MYSRFAFFVGRVVEGDEVSLNQALQNEILPLVRAIPNIVSANFHFCRNLEAGLPEIYAVLEMRYASQENAEASFATKEREEMRNALKSRLAAFRGKVIHMSCDMI